MLNKIRVDIYPVGDLASGSYRIKDHVNLSGKAPRLGFNPITDLYLAKEQAPESSITVAGLSNTDRPTAAEAEVLLKQGITAYSYHLVEAGLYAAAQGHQLDAYGFVPQIPKGFNLLALSAGLKTNTSKLDLAIALADVPCAWAAAFTSNAARAICVNNNYSIYTSEKPVQALICNAGNANACTGIQGINADQQLRDLISNKFQITNSILTASTGKVGVPLPIDKIQTAILNYDINTPNPTAVQDFAEAILTTDLVTKVYQDEACHILGFAKGSGMIAPRLQTSLPQATMFGFLFSDVKLDGYHNLIEMQQAFRRIVDRVMKRSFNAISVDGDTSTNDMVIFMSSMLGASISEEEFEKSLLEVCIDLARKIVLDGEGATKLIEVKLTSDKHCEDELFDMGKVIINSPLLKTAIFGLDPNWGRILVALGNSVPVLNLEEVQVKLCGQELFNAGLPKPQISSPEGRAELSQLMKINKVIEIEIKIGSQAQASAKVYGCDLSYDYVKINAEYFT